MSFYTAAGSADPNGDFEFVDGNLVLRNGRSVGFDAMLMDSAPGNCRSFTDAKSGKGGSIDEAVRQGLAAEADAKQTDVKSMIAGMSSHDFEKLIAKIVTGHIRSKTGEAMVGDHAMNVSDAEYGYAVTAARRKHELMHPGRPFTADQAAGAIADRAAQNAQASALRDALPAIEAYQRSYDEGARIARKHLTSDAWRR